MENWNRLAALALVGTEQGSLPDRDAGSPLAAVALPEGTGPDRALLLMAGAMALYRRADRRPSPLPVTSMPACPPDIQPACSANATALLARILDIRAQALLTEWLGLAARARVRIPHDLLPQVLDLTRKALELLPVLGERSYLLHRLVLLGILWGRRAHGAGSKGTFHERWTLCWQPEMAVALVEAGIWGNTVVEAATRRVVERATADERLAQLTALVNAMLFAGLAEAAEPVLAMSAVSGDIAGLMDALPPLTSVLRYGSVRRTDQELVRGVVDGLVARVCIGLPPACASLDGDATVAILTRIDIVHAALVTADIAEHRAARARALDAVAGGASVHGLIAGRCCRLLFDAGTLEAGEVARRLSLALSTAADAAAGAAWVEGLLLGGGVGYCCHPDRVSRGAGSRQPALSPSARAH